MVKICSACGKKISGKGGYWDFKDGAIICNDCHEIYVKDENKILTLIEENEKRYERELLKRKSSGVLTQITFPEILVVISGFLCFIGAFLPWGNVSSGFSSVSLSGIDKDGFFTLIFSLIALGILYIGIRKIKKTLTNAGIIIFGFLILLIGMYDSANIANISSSSYVFIQVGTGLYLTIIGGIGLIIFGLWNNKESYRGRRETGLQNKEEKEETKEKEMQKSEDEALKTLKLRYAKGEITKEEYEQMKKDIEG